MKITAIIEIEVVPMTKDELVEAYAPEPDDPWTDDDLRDERHTIADGVVSVANFEDNLREALAGSEVMANITSITLKDVS